MTKEEFIQYFDITPDKAKELMELLADIVNSEVQEVIAHADYYINPTDYCDEEFLKQEYGLDVLDKDEDATGYSGLYDFRKHTSAEKCFMDFISYHTKHGGHTSAIRACELMGITGWRD